MLAQLTGRKAFPREIANEIIDRTDGVPLFIEELTKAVVESGILAEIGDRYTVTGPLAPRDRCRPDHGCKIHGPEKAATVARLEDLPSQSCRRHRVDRRVRRPNDLLSSRPLYECWSCGIRGGSSCGRA
jgi:hypothetical protein